MLKDRRAEPGVDVRLIGGVVRRTGVTDACPGAARADSTLGVAAVLLYIGIGGGGDMAPGVDRTGTCQGPDGVGILDILAAGINCCCCCCCGMGDCTRALPLLSRPFDNIVP